MVGTMQNGGRSPWRSPLRSPLRLPAASPMREAGQLTAQRMGCTLSVLGVGLVVTVAALLLAFAPAVMPRGAQQAVAFLGKQVVTSSLHPRGWSPAPQPAPAAAAPAANAVGGELLRPPKQAGGRGVGSPAVREHHPNPHQQTSQQPAAAAPAAVPAFSRGRADELAHAPAPADGEQPTEPTGAPAPPELRRRRRRQQPETQPTAAASPPKGQAQGALSSLKPGKRQKRPRKPERRGGAATWDSLPPWENPNPRPPRTPEQQQAWLRWWWPDGKPRSRRRNETEYQDPWDRPRKAPPEERSFYLGLIREALKPWADAGGILQEDLRASADLNTGYCHGDVMRFQILKGRLWIDWRSHRPAGGWFPGNLGVEFVNKELIHAGNTSGKGHIPFAIFALLDVLRSFPGEIPDVDVVLHTADFPCIKKSPDVEDYDRAYELKRERPTPMFGYNTAEDYLDIPFPDFTYYGHEHSWLLDASGALVVGWPHQADFLRAKYGGVPLWQRRRGLTWRGRTQDPEHPTRDALRRRFAACPQLLRAAGRAEDAALFDLQQAGAPNMTLADSCDFRYNMYIESKAYSSNLRQKLVCGSPLLAPRMRHFEWWTKALEPGRHYIEVSSGDDICDDIVAKVREMDQLVDEEEEAAAAADASGDGAGGGRSGGGSSSEAGGSTGGSDQTAAPQDSRLAGREGDAGDSASKTTSSSNGGDGASGASADADAGGHSRVAGSESRRRRRRRLLADGGGQPAAAAAQQAGSQRGGRGRKQGDGEVHSWGSGLSPTDISAAAQQFLDEHLRLEDVRLYLKDLLVEYHVLQRFTPFRSETAACMNYDRMLREFGAPHPRKDNYDEDLLAKYYPFLRDGEDIYSCDDEDEVPFYWECEAVQDWQPRHRKWWKAKPCNLPFGEEAQPAWEADPVGGGYSLPDGALAD